MLKRTKMKNIIDWISEDVTNEKLNEKKKINKNLNWFAKTKNENK